jgi:hypothetical protein
MKHSDRQTEVNSGLSRTRSDNKALPTTHCLCCLIIFHCCIRAFCLPKGPWLPQCKRACLPNPNPNPHHIRSCNCGHRPIAMWAAPASRSLPLHGHSSRIPRDDFMQCHPRGAQLNAEQHWPPNPPYVQDAQLRPITLDQLLSSPCRQAIAAAERNEEGVKILVMSNKCLKVNAPLCSTHEMPSSCNFGHSPFAM